MPRQGVVDGALFQLFVPKTKYVVVYRIRADMVEILRVLHTARNRRT